jgi:ubiquinone/menaquinone biosynthesis C-methylase UbiE
MKLNKFEFVLMNNPIRAFIQKKYEIRILRKMSPITNIGIALEIGCGSGYGTKLIKQHFCAKKIEAIDLDEKMIEIARRKNRDSSIQYYVMDASTLSFADSTFDAIFDFGIIHHVPNWKDCISEMHRVLKDNGQAIIEELSIDTFNTLPGRIWKGLLDHPYHDMFSTGEFLESLAAKGFELQEFSEYQPLRLFKHFALVAKKLAAHYEAARLETLDTPVKYNTLKY